MSFHIERRGTGVPLVLLHGWGFHSGIWTGVSEGLYQNFEIYAVDLPGCGLSPLSSYQFDDLIPSLLAHLPEQFYLLGWSLGGMIAMQMALLAPKRVLKLISVASSPCFVAELSWPGMSPQVLNNFALRLQDNSVKTLSEFLLLQSGQGEQGRLMYKRLLPGLKRSQPHPEALSSGLSVLKNQDLRADIERLESPTLFLYGALDSIVPQSVALEVKALLPSSEYTVFKKSAHAPFLTHQDLFIERLRDFLS